MSFVKEGTLHGQKVGICKGCVLTKVVQGARGKLKMRRLPRGNENNLPWG